MPAATSPACSSEACAASTKRRCSQHAIAQSRVLWEESPLAERIAEVADGSFRHREPPEIKGTGYVVQSLEAALWAFSKSQDFREGALLAANLGDDADTTAAIYGQIAGATYGVEAIPPDWRTVLTMVTEITSMADNLYHHARQTLPVTPHLG